MHIQNITLDHGSLLGLEIVAGCAVVASLVAVACCMKRRSRQRRSGKKGSRLKRTPRSDDYQDAISTTNTNTITIATTAPPKLPLVGSDGYTDVQLFSEDQRARSLQPPPSDYNQLVVGVRPARRTLSDPGRARRAYDHVVMDPSARSARLKTCRGVIGKNSVTSGRNEYDVSLPWRGARRTEVIGDVYDKPKVSVV